MPDANIILSILKPPAQLTANMAAAAIGPPGDISQALLIANRLSELSTDEQAKADARANLDLQNIDGGTFF